MSTITAKKNKKYAGQVVDIPRGDHRLVFDDCLQPLTEEEGDPYLMVFSKKSIYLLSILDAPNSISLKANIPLKALPAIYKHTEYAGRYLFDQVSVKRKHPPKLTAEPASCSLPLAFTKLKLGKFKGKSPGDLLLDTKETDQMKAELAGQLDFLKRNLSRYPDNQNEINAIEDAINYFELGLLYEARPKEDTRADCQEQKEGNPDIEYIEIYCPPMKYFKEQDQEQRYKCYSLEITCHPANMYPYHIELVNCYAPISLHKSGITPILKNKAVNKQSLNFDLTEEEWLYVLDCLKDHTKRTKALWYPYFRKEDVKRRWKRGDESAEKLQA